MIRFSDGPVKRQPQISKIWTWSGTFNGLCASDILALVITQVLDVLSGNG